MDEVARRIDTFRAQADLSVVSRLDALMDIERLRDPRVVRFLLDVLADEREPVEVRVHALKHVRDNCLTDGLREPAASTILRLVRDGCPARLRLYGALALGEFTDVAGVSAGLASVAQDRDVALDIRYSAFISLERAGPTVECVAALEELLSDDALGASARSLLLSWRIGFTSH